MPFAEVQIRQLAGKLPERHVKTREQRGATLSYLEGWHAIAEANRIFGFDGWDREMISADCVWQDARSNTKVCAYTARVRIRVRAGDTIVFRDGSGVGHGAGATLGEAHESALKEAETDATKRALTTFGNLFGLALYDKEKAGVRHSPKRKHGMERDLTISWILFGTAGEVMGAYDAPRDFCRALKEAMCAMTEAESLGALWQRNAPALDHLRAALPDLRTAKGAHYADLLERHFHDHTRRLNAAPVETGPGPGQTFPDSMIDKSELTIAAPKRIRDEDHLRLVASQPCLVCGRTPAHAHHLRFAQLRSMGSKVSDEWAVPLCHLHHRALHDVGSEEIYWQGKGIDAKAEAERLWNLSRGRSGETAADTCARNAIPAPRDDGVSAVSAP